VLKRQEEFRRAMEAEPVQYLWRRHEERLEPSRTALAKFVGVGPKDIVFVTNATTGVNAVIRSIRWQAGDEILTTNLDYNACRNVLMETARITGARVVIAKVPFPVRTKQEIIDAVLRMVTKRTRLAFLDHVTSESGIILPIAQLIRELKSRGVETFVDGAHAPGMVPLNLSKLGATYYTANLHKWTCAPKGAAFLWVREDRQSEIQPPVISHGNNSPRPDYTPFQDRFDWAGTFDPSAWYCAGEAIHWMEGLLPGGWSAIREHNHQLVVDARRLLCARLGVEVPCPESFLGSLATIPLPEGFPDLPRREKIDAAQAQLYDQFGVEVPFVRFGEPPRRAFRISAHIYNTIEEYAYLAEALLQMAARVRATKGLSGSPEPLSQKTLAAKKRSRKAGEMLK
jgi:isopenicillin-N epimerase